MGSVRSTKDGIAVSSIVEVLLKNDKYKILTYRQQDYNQEHEYNEK
jgi:hypothetical protein